MHFSKYLDKYLNNDMVCYECVNLIDMLFIESVSKVLLSENISYFFLKIKNNIYLLIF